MNKSELVDEVASQAGVSKADAEKVLSSYFDTVKAQAKKGDKVAWPGFGSFSTTKRKARTGRNPQTGGTVKIPASTAMKFSPSSSLKDYLNNRGTAKKTAAKKSAKKSAKKGAAKKGAAKKGAAKKKSAAKKATKRR